MNGVTNAEHAALRDITTPKGRYKLVRVDNTTYPGADIEKVLFPDKEDPAWYIVLKDGTRIISTHSVTVVENAP